MDFDPRDSDSRDESRWPDRDRESPDRAFDSREPFTRDLDLPRGWDREIVRDRDREYTLRGSATRTLTTVGAFRVVSSRDLQDQHGRPLDPRSTDRQRHIQGLTARQDRVKTDARQAVHHAEPMSHLLRNGAVVDDADTG